MHSRIQCGHTCDGSAPRNPHRITGIGMNSTDSRRDVLRGPYATGRAST